MSNTSGSNTFVINSGKIAASGNIMFLMDKTGELRDLTGKSYCFRNMFAGCDSLTKAPELPATILAEYCYDGMFRGCTSLTKASFPNLEKEIVTTDIVENQQAFTSAASDIEATCYDGILVINSTTA